MERMMSDKKIVDPLADTCETCRFWRRNPGAEGDFGLCMRWPPKIFMAWMMAPSLADPRRQELKWADNTAFPVVGEVGWCGEHQVQGVLDKVN